MKSPDVDRWTGRAPPLAVVVVLVTAVALLARLLLLGDRIAHWDEGRVGYDILRYAATGMWEYRPIVHGPFLHHVNKHVFALVGPTDFTARLVVAVIGGLLPLSAWLFRNRLRDVEVAALALFLAADPILLYYSRFMRNDVLVAGFAFAAVGCFVRLSETGRSRYLYAGTGLFALAFTTKENAVLTVVALAVSLLLLFDHRLFLARTGEPPWTTVAADRLDRTAAGLWRFRHQLVVAALGFVVILVGFYAPRGGAGGQVGLWEALARPSALPAVIEAGTLGAAEILVERWVVGDLNEHPFLPYFTDYVETLVIASGPLAFLALVGFLTDRYRNGRPRDVVALGFYWGLLGVIGYPIAIDIRSAWAVVHAVVPLALPAAAGVAVFVDWGREAAASDDRISLALAGFVLLVLAGGMVGTAASTSYLHPQSEGNVMVQYAQPAGDMRPALQAMAAAADEHDGVDVVWYGHHFYLEDERAADRLPVDGSQWYNRLPLPWYLEAAGAEVTSVNNSDGLAATVAAERPPVIITREADADAIEADLEGYTPYAYEGRQFDSVFVFFIDDPYAPPAAD